MTDDTEPSKGLPRRQAVRYVTALREGGSLPAIVETDDGRMFVAKWRGAGQGAAALVAEVIAGEIGRAMGLPIPELAVVTLDEALATTERHQEIRDLLMASLGDNLGMGYLSGALAFDPAAKPEVGGQLASRIVVFDAYVTNVDRTARNTNMLWQDGALWLIDHGAALYWHHGWDVVVDQPDRSFPMIKDHVLLPWADDIAGAAAHLQAAVTDDVLAAAIEAVPASWLPSEDGTAKRLAYLEFMRARRDRAAAFVEEAERARAAL